jgi:hypothetical protein
MEEARQVLERLARIEELEREQVPPAELLGELRELVREAEAWARAERQGDRAIRAVERCRSALAEQRREEVVLLGRE